MALEDERFGVDRNRAIALKLDPYRAPAKPVPVADKRLQRLDAPWSEVVKNARNITFHAKRFANGASDDLAIDAWTYIMDRRQKSIKINAAAAKAARTKKGAA